MNESSLCIWLKHQIASPTVQKTTTKKPTTNAITDKKKSAFDYRENEAWTENRKCLVEAILGFVFVKLQLLIEEPGLSI